MNCFIFKGDQGPEGINGKDGDPGLEVSKTSWSFCNENIVIDQSMLGYVGK